MSNDREVKLLKEYHEVAIRAEKLQLFIEEGDVFSTLSEREQELLKIQLAAMVTYMTVLECRI